MASRGRLRTLVQIVLVLALVQLFLLIYSGWTQSIEQGNGFHKGHHTSDPLTYNPPWDATIKGRHFVNVSMETVQSLHIPFSEFITLNLQNLQDFVIAIPADHLYFPRAVDAIATAQKYFPKHKIILYDLGNIRPKYDKQLSKLCRVEYRKFDFSRYPDHVRILAIYAWKALLLNEVLKEYPGVFMMDSSIRFISNNFDPVKTDLLQTEGVLGFSLGGTSNFATTHHQMYEYLPTDIRGMQETDQMESGSVFFFRTRRVCEDILHWLLLCSLEQNCIAPTRNRGCLQTKHRTDYADCHRFDQSALNILLANIYGFDHENYLSKKQLIKVQRYSWGEEEISVCEDGTEKTLQTELLFPDRVKD